MLRQAVLSLPFLPFIRFRGYAPPTLDWLVFLFGLPNFPAKCAGNRNAIADC
jgi:hypothetical protein